MPSLTEILRTIDTFNDAIIIPSPVYNGVSGILVIVVILAMQYYKYTPSNKYRYGRKLYFTASLSVLAALGVNRLFNYPPEVTLSTFVFLGSYLLHAGHTLYVGATRQREFARCGMK